MDRLTEIRLWHEDVKMRYDDKPSRAHQDREVLLSEIDKLQAEVERLREALRDIERGDYSDPMCERTPEQRAREALEVKP